MNFIRKSLLLASTTILGGCYTQLAVNSEEPAVAYDTPTVEIFQPPPVIIIVDPVISPPPVYEPLPVGVVTRPAPAQQSPSRDIGNHRSDSGRSGSRDSDNRTTGPGRGGR